MYFVSKHIWLFLKYITSLEELTHNNMISDLIADEISFIY